MQKQTKPFIVEIKPSRKQKAGSEKPSIWGKLNLRPEETLQSERDHAKKSPVPEDGGRR